MTTIVEKNLTELNEITAKLFTTLEESEFFGELAQFIGKSIACDKYSVYVVNENSDIRQIILDNKKSTKNISLNKSDSYLQHVVKTKRPYFSNNISRDPLFHGLNLKVDSLLILPIIFEGVIISIMTFSGKEADFSVNDLTLSLDILTKLERPISNMKMYITAQNLNVALLKRIEEAEQALAQKDNKSDISNNFILQEENFIYKNPKMKEIVEYSEKISSTDVSIHLLGPSGSGKESLAKKIHLSGSKAKGPFITFDCSDIGVQQLDEEIFGKVESSEQGPIEKLGLLELADNGTLLLKNVDSIKFPIQTKLAEFIKNKRGMRSNVHTTFKSDVRIISTSKKDLEKMVLEGTYREDLYYLFSTVSIRIPELKQRPEDIEALANYFLNADKPVEKHKSLTPCLIRALKEHSWEGNIRELKSVIEKAYYKSNSIVVDKEQLPLSVIVQPTVEVKEEENLLSAYSGMTLGDLERVYICNTLGQLDGNKTKTAKVLGITVKTLYNKLHSYGMIAPKQE
ncbi:MAG: sigma-54-dependent Fis family transcriptional regulator [Bacteriovoracaceae bacterium]